jgi:hypothetical protein
MVTSHPSIDGYEQLQARRAADGLLYLLYGGGLIRKESSPLALYGLALDGLGQAVAASDHSSFPT